MITREELQGTWTQLKGQIRERWGQITDDELQQVHGDAEQFVGFLQKKTGQTRRDVENFVREVIDGSQAMSGRAQQYAQQAADTARGYADQVAQSMRNGYVAAEENFAEGLEDAQQMVRSRPLESLTTAFGAGIITGVVLSLILRPSRS